jgi:hypothetical protein
MSLKKFDFSIPQPKKTAKQALFNIGKAALLTCHPRETISFLGIDYNIVNKLGEEIGKLDEQTARKAIEKIKGELAGL